MGEKALRRSEGALANSPSPRPSAPEGRGSEPPRPHRQRHDGFTPKKQRKFFKMLKKTGCLRDAARAAGISTNTVRRHRDKWPAFNAKVEAALGQAADALETLAWHRATVGAEEKIYRDGELVAVRVKPSDAMLRLLLQGANPKKYGRTGMMPKGLALERLKQEAKKELKREMYAKRGNKEEEIMAIMRRLGGIREDRARRAEREEPDSAVSAEESRAGRRKPEQAARPARRRASSSDQGGGRRHR